MGIVNGVIKRVVRMQLRSTYARGFDLARWRAFMDGLGRLARVPRGVRLEPVDADGVPATWFRPEVESDRVALYLHGGMYLGGSVHSYRELIGRLCRAAAVNILAPDYRLAPEHPFPAAVADARRVYAWLCARHGAPVVMGDSAGGGLALATMLGAGAAPSSRPVAGVLLSPWTDLTLSGASIHERDARDPILKADALRVGAGLYLGLAEAEHPDASPLFAELSGLPPLLIHVGTEEVLYDDAVRLAERARAQGVQVELRAWQGMMHDFQSVAALLREGRESIDQIGAFCRAQLPAPG